MGGTRVSPKGAAVTNTKDVKVTLECCHSEMFLQCIVPVKLCINKVCSISHLRVHMGSTMIDFCYLSERFYSTSDQW